MILVLAVILIIIILITILDNNVIIEKIKIKYSMYELPVIPDIDTYKTPKCAILLTTFVGGNVNTVDMYTKNIYNWLTQTDFDIYVINSSSVYFPLKHNRLKQYAFQQESGSTSSSKLERDSVREAYRQFKYFRDYEYVFKITGKYFSPDLQSQLKYIPEDTDFLIQNQGVPHTEIIGGTPDTLLYLYNRVEGNIIEHELALVIREKKHRIYKLKNLRIKNKVPRGDGIILKKL